MFEVATFQIFVMISAQKRGYDVTKAAELSLIGFEEIIPLTAAEKSVLFASYIARLIILAVSSVQALSSATSPFSRSQVQFFMDSSCYFLQKFYQENRKSI